MPDKSRGPAIQRGALVGIDLFNPVASTIVFQYNPEKLSRTLQARGMSDGEGAKSEALRLTGAPIENIQAEILIDATDQLAEGSETARTMGIYPQLAALEMLLYPKSIQVTVNAVLASKGIIEVVSPQAPLTLFVWGWQRVVPVRIGGLTIVEQAYDNKLHPIRATVQLDMRVLTYSDLSFTNPGAGIYFANQVLKEIMATVASVNRLQDVFNGNVSIF